ncbi:hypothetical protein P167DRAFT_536441 [Morchella conica CCBAS932]|uniref:Uncharacterized protein n=1 Tax=Morchella conica CCBAS932 TaxID=1392247 RepID=A0A3N4KMJ8_9PEZI|nr:hypothetical protein P167DRAFT_536441 [Morchella conica CCBAS932]
MGDKLLLLALIGLPTLGLILFVALKLLLLNLALMIMRRLPVLRELVVVEAGAGAGARGQWWGVGGGGYGGYGR